MPLCIDCGHPYKGAPPRDERCEERHRDRRREREDLVGCQHGGKTFISSAAFDRHAWQVYYREHFHPKRYRVQQ